ncbi:MAG: phage scaffolding protein [Aerococcus sp.]|nr:phage scaffolding protein [Aerococcus sp.]
MKREELKALDLTPEQIDQIMAIHGKDMANQVDGDQLKDQIKELEQQLSDRDKSLKKLKKDHQENEDLQKQIADLEALNKQNKQSYEQKIQDMERNTAVDKVLNDYHVRNHKAVKALLDDQRITYKSGELTGLTEQLDTLKDKESYLFDLGSQEGGYHPKGGQSSTFYSSFTEAMKAGDVDAYIQAQANTKES